MGRRGLDLFILCMFVYMFVYMFLSLALSLSADLSAPCFLLSDPGYLFTRRLLDSKRSPLQNNY